MRSILVSAIAIGAWSLGVAGLHAQNLLTNGTLDATAISQQTLATPVGWNVVATRAISGPFADGASSEGFAGDPPTPDTDPGDTGLFIKPFQGTTADGDLTVHFTQDNPAVAGVTYALTAWAGAATNYSGLIPGSRTRTELAVEFLDVASGVVGGNVLDLRTAGLGSAAGQAFGYALYSVTATAPAGTVSVRARMSMIDGFANPAGGPHALVTDDYTLTVIPEPAAWTLATLGLSAFACRRRRVSSRR